MVQEHFFTFYGPPNGLLSFKVNVEREPATNRNFIKIYIERI